MDTTQTSKKHALAFIYTTTLFAVMGVATITPAFPDIIRHFELKSGQIAWLITAFTFPGIILAPIMGILADKWGRKTILVPSLVVFALAGGACMFTQSYEMLVGLRVIQGLGAASLGSLNVTIIGDLFTPAQRPRIMGINASVLSIGTAVYPFVGGLLAALSWNYVFALPLLALILAVLIAFGLHLPPTEATKNWPDYFKRLWLVVNNRVVWRLFALNTLAFIILYGSYLTFFPLLMSGQYQATSVLIGVLMSAMSVTTAVVASQSGRWHRLFSQRMLLSIASAIYALSMLLMAYAVNWWLVGLSVAFFGMGHGLFMPAIQTLLVSKAPISQRAAFMSINSMVLRLGQTLGPVLITLFYFTDNNFTPVFLAGFAAAVIMIALSLLGKPD